MCRNFTRSNFYIKNPNVRMGKHNKIKIKKTSVCPLNRSVVISKRVETSKNSLWVSLWVFGLQKNLWFRKIYRQRRFTVFIVGDGSFSTHWGEGKSYVVPSSLVFEHLGDSRIYARRNLWLFIRNYSP